MVRLRFAPSPTGLLHVGNARIALVNWMLARREGGTFFLRLDDTDAERSRPAFSTAIVEDLHWLGLDFEGPVHQSERLDLYRECLDRLVAAGRVYPCFESPEELELQRKRLLASGKPPIYNRAALHLSTAEIEAFEAEGRRAHYRFKLSPGTIEWQDMVHGPLRFEAGDLSDPVVIRSDGRPLFTWSSCVDDADMGITHILRGDDHISNTAAQIQIFEALGNAVPSFGHLPLLLDARGRNLSKRDDSLSLKALRETGIEPMTVASYLALMGTSAAIEPRPDLDSLIADFDLGTFSTASPRFDPDELVQLNARLLHARPFDDELRERLEREVGGGPVPEEFWLAVRANLTTVADAGPWWRVCFAEITPVMEDPDLCAAAVSALPAAPWHASTWSQESWQAWTARLSEETGRKGRSLFMPLRVALTGVAHGPELRNLLPLIGYDRTRARLSGHVA
jgi:glutamyl-tRNA synthetase